MSCKSNQNQPGGINQQQFSTFIDSQGAAIPDRPNMLRLLTDDHDRAQGLGLKRGSYRVETEIQFQGDRPAFIQDTEKAIPIGGELKRVFFHKIEAKNIRPSDEFTNKADAIIEFTVIDNVIPVAPIIWGASIVASGVSGYFFVDKVQEFTETTTGSIITVGAAIVGIIVGIRVLTA